ncbi:hypothetical protein Q5425_44810 [Amycolatopsis sp. A133]|uniref:hypothetical protein n=1 Tax=Amycolatopsis sp. A133 TaxID=3064472 RepID=UPI0027F39133|nr:hypothetical protein [Amycolatopsis sp. A133]MDQ7810889.1 hypothetical protein [Amycolatopsis sp. A133]
MSLLKVPRFGRRKAGVSTRRVGEALVVHGPAGMTAQAGRLASALPAEAGRTLVVVDFPADAPPEHWKALATAVAGDRCPVRLFPAEKTGEVPLDAVQWLADRIGQPVLCPDGALPGSTGVVFLPPSTGRGWAVCAPDQEPEWRGRRFPVPEWEEPANTTPARVGETTTAEPLPAGLWLRTDGRDDWLEAGRAKLTRWLSVSPREFTVVLGAHGTPPLPLTDVVRWWATVAPENRARTRFFCFGELAGAGSAAPGQALADALGEEVVCHGGLPAGRPDAPEVFALREDGSHGIRTFAEQLAFRPRRDPGADAPVPRVRRARRPGDGLTELRPGVYQHESLAVVEVVQAGLWVRTPDESGQAGDIRTTPPDPAALLVFHDPADDDLVARVLGPLPDKDRAAVRPVPVSTPVGSPPVPFGADLTRPLTPLPRLSRLLQRQTAGSVAVAPERRSAVGARPAPDDDAVAVTTKIRYPAVATLPAPRPAYAETVAAQPTPEVRAWPLPEGFRADRAVVRTDREAAFDALSDRVGAVMRRFSPGRPVPESALTAAVATGLYLASADPDVDAALRAGTAGPHLDFGRCVAAGLQKLPGHRKATATVLDPGSPVWSLLEPGTVLREWGFFHTRTCLGPVGGGSTDLVVWSLTGRLTASLEPEDDGVADRVVFPPGTGFKVLEAVEPAGAQRGRILVRELAPAEAGTATGRDDLVRAALRTFTDRGTRAPAPVPSAQAHRFGRVPGVDAAPDGQV